MSNKKVAPKEVGQPTQQEMFEQVLQENARLRAALQDKNTYETMEQLRMFIEIAKSNIFLGDVETDSYVKNKIKEVILPPKQVAVEEPETGF